jgi:hypothetical protein
MDFCVLRTRIFVLALFVLCCMSSGVSFASSGEGHGKGSHPAGVLTDAKTADGHGATHIKGGDEGTKREISKTDAVHSTGGSEAEDEAALHKSAASEHNEDNAGSEAKEGEHGAATAESKGKNLEEKGVGVGGGLLWFAGVFALLILFVFFFT